MLTILKDVFCYIVILSLNESNLARSVIVTQLKVNTRKIVGMVLSQTRASSSLAWSKTDKLDRSATGISMDLYD